MAEREQITLGEIWLTGGSYGTVTVLLRNANGKALLCTGTSIPADASAGYAPGCEFVLSTINGGQYARFINMGDATYCAFTPVGPVTGYGIAVGAGSVACSNGVTAFTTALEAVRAFDIAFTGFQVSDDSDQILATICADGSIGATLSADPLVAHGVNVIAVRPTGCHPQYDIFAAGKHTTVAGQVYNDITVPGVTSSDLVFATYSVSNDTDVICKAAYQTTNTIRVTMSADPLTAHQLSYVVLRPAGSFKPSHYIFAAGVHTTTADGGGVNAISIDGALATDIPLVCYNTTDDTDTIVKAVPSAGALTVTMSADPGTTHKLAYMLLRAY